MSGSGDGFAVDPDTLGAHAAVVGGLAAALTATAEAARPMDADAYGLVGRSYAQWAIGAAARADHAIGRMGLTLATYPSALQQSTDGYRQAEEQAVALLRGALR